MNDGVTYQSTYPFRQLPDLQVGENDDLLNPLLDWVFIISPALQ